MHLQITGPALTVLAVVLIFIYVIVLLTVVSVISLLFAAIPCGFLLLLGHIALKKRESIYQELLHSVQGQTNNYFPVMYSSQQRFKKRWKYVYIDNIGILLLSEKKIIFKHFDKHHHINDIIFNINTNQVKWIGIDWWGSNGLRSWFSLEKDGITHYFTADVGIYKYLSFNLNSLLSFSFDTKTREIYNEIQKTVISI